MQKQILFYLKLIYCLINFSIVIFTGIFVGLSSNISSKEQVILSSTYFIIVIFIMFMLVVLYKYLPNNIYMMTYLLFSPFIYSIYTYFFAGESFYDYLVMNGIMFVSSIMLAFTILVILGPLFTTEKEKIREVLNYIPIALAQLVFIIPGILAVVIFMNYLNFSIYTIESFIILFVLIQNIYIMTRNLHKQILV